MTAKKPTSSIVEQSPILERALEDARQRLPEGSIARSYPSFDRHGFEHDYTLRFELVTRYDPSLNASCAPPHNMPPIARTTGDWNAFYSEGDAANEVRKALAEHETLLGDIYAGKYKG